MALPEVKVVERNGKVYALVEITPNFAEFCEFATAELVPGNGINISNGVYSIELVNLLEEIDRELDKNAPSLRDTAEEDIEYDV